MQSLEGRTVMLADLEVVTARITELYHAQGYPLAYAYIPAQTIRGGVIRLAVVEPHYDRIAIDNRSRLKSTQARQILNLKSGETIEQASLNRGLLLLSRTPGIRAAGTFVPGASLGTSTLKVSLTNTPLAGGHVFADNSGGVDTGRARAGFDASLYNPFGYGSQISINGLQTSGGLLRTGGFNLSSPYLWRGLRAGVYGSRTEYRLGGAFANLQQKGSATQIGGYLSDPLILQPGQLLNLKLDVLRNDFEQNNISAGSRDESHITLARLSLEGAYTDRWGGMTFGSASISRGELSLDNPAAALADAAGPGAQGEFWVGHLFFGYTHPLPAAMQLRLSLRGQVSSRNLDGSEKFYLGGPDGVMSYPVGDAGGDEGALLRMQLSRAVNLPNLPGKLNASLLLQSGKVWVNHTSYPGATGDNQLSRSGAGIELTYQYKDRFSAQFAYVHRIGAATPTSGQNHNGEIWANLNFAF